MYLLHLHQTILSLSAIKVFKVFKVFKVLKIFNVLLFKLFKITLNLVLAAYKRYIGKARLRPVGPTAITHNMS